MVDHVLDPADRSGDRYDVVYFARENRSAQRDDPVAREDIYSAWVGGGPAEFRADALNERVIAHLAVPEPATRRSGDATGAVAYVTRGCIQAVTCKPGRPHDLVAYQGPPPTATAGIQHEDHGGSNARADEHIFRVHELRLLLS